MAISIADYEKMITDTTKEQATRFKTIKHAEFIKDYSKENNRDYSIDICYDEKAKNYYLEFSKNNKTIGYLKYNMTLTEKLYFWVLGKFGNEQ